MGVQFAVPRADDFTVSISGSYREESDGSRTLKIGGSYRANYNSGYWIKGDRALFFPKIIIKNSRGQTLKTINQQPRRIGQFPLDFSITENFPYSILKDESLTVTVSFHSGRGSSKPRYPDGRICNKNCPDSSFSGLLSSNIVNSGLIQLVNVQEETRIANIETERLAVIEKSRLANIEEQRLADIELRRLTLLKNNMLLLAEIRRNKIDVGEDRLIELLNIEKNQKSKITPEILPSIVATSSLLPLGIIALLLYTKGGLK